MAGRGKAYAQKWRCRLAGARRVIDVISCSVHPASASRRGLLLGSGKTFKKVEPAFRKGVVDGIPSREKKFGRV